jgi:hypothetical protein
MNPAKRRRLDESNSVLSKPFKSPVIKKKQAPDDYAAQPTPPSKATTIDQPPSSPPKLSSSPGLPTLRRPTATYSSLSSPTRPTPSRQRPTSLIHATKDPTYVALQKQHSALLLELSHLRTTLDTAQQAVKISTSATDAELEALIHKWRTASREAAEELFRGARDRVNKMGGVGAWRERSRQQQGGWGDDDEGEKNEDGSELTPAQREARAVMMEEMKAEMEKYGEKKEQVVEEKDDESFTMDMMLRQLNVEPDVIGYDKASQRWV